MTRLTDAQKAELRRLVENSDLDDYIEVGSADVLALLEENEALARLKPVGSPLNQHRIFLRGDWLDENGAWVAFNLDGTNGSFWLTHAEARKIGNWFLALGKQIRRNAHIANQTPASALGAVDTAEREESKT